MAGELLVPNGDDSGWTSGAFGDIDEEIANVDGALMLTTVNPDVVILDLSASAVVDADTVTEITIDLWARVVGIGGKDDIVVDLLIGGVAQGAGVTHTSVGGTLGLLSATLTEWDVDRSASDMAGMQVQLSSVQRGKGEDATYEVDAVDVNVTYTLGSSGIAVPLAFDHLSMGHHS